MDKEGHDMADDAANIKDTNVSAPKSSSSGESLKPTSEAEPVNMEDVESKEDGDVADQPNVADQSLPPKPTPRLMIWKMVLENFKSYAGVREIGPFHKVSGW